MCERKRKVQTYHIKGKAVNLFRTVVIAEREKNVWVLVAAVLYV